MALTAGTKLGTYEIVGLVGAGGMGEVYKARDTRLNRTVAVKVERVQSSGKFRAVDDFVDVKAAHLNRLQYTPIVSSQQLQ